MIPSMQEDPKRARPEAVLIRPAAGRTGVGKEALRLGKSQACYTEGCNGASETARSIEPMAALDIHGFDTIQSYYTIEVVKGTISRVLRTAEGRFIYYLHD
ncbi:hypothetical protein J6590_025551 [Homalodisca vitripennis]|nr:hypothetical protein J6590_025551 [Homalodisca vitripennis]